MTSVSFVKFIHFLFTHTASLPLNNFNPESSGYLAGMQRLVARRDPREIENN